MVSFYRLKNLDFQLPTGSHILSADEMATLISASALISEAEASAAQIREDAQAVFTTERARGYAEGYRQAEIDAAAFLFSENALLAEKLTQLETDLSALVVDCVRRLVDDFSDSEKAVSFIRSALRKMRSEKAVHVRVSPDRITEIRGSVKKLFNEFSEIDLIDVIEDAALKPSRIIIESAFGRIEADLDDSIARLHQLLLAEAPEESQDV